MKPKTWTLPKFRRCAELIDSEGAATSEEILAGILERLWFTVGTFDSENGGTGRIPEFYFDSRPDLCELLITYKWIERVDGELYIHDWDEHKPRNLRENDRKREYKLAQRGANGAQRGALGAQRGALNAQSAPHSGSGSGSGSPLPTGGSMDSMDPRTPVENMDQFCISVEELRPMAKRLFDAIGYRGDNGRNLWKIAASLHAGLLCDADVWGLAEVAAQRKDPPAYLYASLRRNLQEIDHDLQTIFKQITITPKWPKEYPHAS